MENQSSSFAFACVVYFASNWIAGAETRESVASRLWSFRDCRQVVTLTFLTYFEGSRVPEAFCENEQLAEKWRWEGVWDGNIPPLGLFICFMV